MRILRIAKNRILSLFQRSRAESSLQREIDLHLDLLTRELIAEGMDEKQARQEARRQFGPAELTKEDCRDMRRTNVVEDLLRDAAYAFRSFRKSKGFAATAILSIALGVGVNTVVFGVLSALILRPQPVREPERLQFVNLNGGPGISIPAYRDIRDRNTVFDSLYVYRITHMALGNDSGDGARRVWGLLVTGNYFETLGIQPALGRFFTPAEDQHVNASPYAVISYETWQTRFAADAGIAGRDIRLNGRSYRVLGVAPKGFHGTEAFYWPEIWVPLTMQPHIEGNSWLECRNCGNAWIAGRLKSGVSVEQAESNLQSIAEQLGKEHRVHQGMKLTLSPPGMAGSLGRGPTQAFTGGIMLLAFLVLLAACANLAALQTARGVDRDRELGIRLSIGASRGRIVRQLLTESFLLSMLGGAAGLGLAVVLLQVLTQWRAPLEFPIAFDVTADWRVFVFAFGIALLTGTLLGLGLARRAWKTQPALAMRGTSQKAAGVKLALRDLLLPAQIALCCMLVASSIVAVRGLLVSVNGKIGYQPDGVAVVSYDVSFAGYDQTRGRAFHARMAEQLARLPGVQSVAYSNSVPLSLDHSTSTIYAESTVEFIPKNSHQASYYQVSPTYFQTIGTKLLSGREFTLHDKQGSRAVAIINATFARRVIGTVDAVGRRFRLGSKTLLEVVGVVEDGKYETLTEAPKLAVFFPILQSYNSNAVLLVSSNRPESEIVGEMRRLIAKEDPNLAIFATGSLRQMLGVVYLPMRAAAIALGAFGALALMLAITGIYGLSAYTVSRRAREIGIRMAIGARQGQVLSFVFGRLGRLVTCGALLGIAGAWGAASLLASIVYQASPRDPLVIGATSITIALVSMAAALGPARRAVRIDPVSSLRQE